MRQCHIYPLILKNIPTAFPYPDADSMQNHSIQELDDTILAQVNGTHGNHADQDQHKHCSVHHSRRRHCFRYHNHSDVIVTDT